MNVIPTYLGVVLYAVLPYVALALFFLVTIHRYRAQTFTYSSLSSQLLENQQHFWALVPFHYGLLVVLAGHLIAFLIPRQLLWFNGNPARLYILEVIGLIFGLSTLIGIVAIVLRRLSYSKVRVVTSWADWVLYGLLFVQVFTGVLVAIFYRWGSSWFAAAMTPYLWSLVKLNPQIAYLTGLPWLVQLHVINAFILIGFFPFTRLVHILVVPIPYLWRKPQVVRWYRRVEAGE
ncbi:MAG: respiratory nitrate reductase subunit gamma [bacterium]